ncbi:hypothetical protein H0H10_14135 [Streptomyces sp. TRM S81-3]|uniref:Uncharacterized protein n=1 Tax=Streptomyces griseicoloratus TaxID=2752516 RepID=A0A926L4J5_9ACTN|nr:hypothetical protein [Streptomyces griseicoloratus]MBD0420276.1 hypothetical protein [Streptomyces griseicoloratus]
MPTWGSAGPRRMNHRDAMGVLHGRGFMVNEEDASPEGRVIILNSGWKVCH